MASPFAFAWMLLKDSARVPKSSMTQRDDGGPVSRPLSGGSWETGTTQRDLGGPQPIGNTQHPPMPRPDEGPTMGEMADMSPEEKEFELNMAHRRSATKPEDPAQKTLLDFD